MTVKMPFCVGMEYPVRRTPIIRRDSIEAQSGRTTNLPRWSQPRYRFGASFNLQDADWKRLEGFWKRAMTSPGQLFLFPFLEDSQAKDWRFGHAAVGREVQYLAPGDGSTTEFQLVRDVGGFSEVVTAPRVNMVVEDFCLPAWTKTGTSIASANYTDPFQTNAVKINEDTSTGNHLVAHSMSSAIGNEEYTVSFYAKAGERTWVLCHVYPKDGNDNGYFFDLSAGKIGSVLRATETNVRNVFMEALGSGWFRCGFTINMRTGATTPEFWIQTSTGDGVYNFTGIAANGLYLFGPQAEQGAQISPRGGDVASPYPLGPVIYQHDYQELCSPRKYSHARTNVVIRSQDFSNASWAKVETTLPSTSQSAPDGTGTATQVRETAVNSTHSVQASSIAGLADNLIVTLSVFVKSDGRNAIALDLNLKNGLYVRQFFNLAGATLGATAGTGVLLRAEIFDIGVSGWHRCSVTANIGSGGSAVIPDILLSDGTGVSYLGDITKGVLLWGAMVENGSRATRYIPTTASAVAVTDYTLSAVGKVTFAAAPASGILQSWSGSFDWLCQFDGEEAEFENFAYRFWNLGDISFTSYKVP
ncbi:MAG: hypothetical protein A3E01_09915 [Gammaproteobacteria bacterium RIFCSPHIGHO2_12_FULL_63_22]|nr:MAG: hypothetical protein A3E01_09915 [Gammaproteobacteria bacterium RIFCSPHIGHO2_12_FULL_63_22]